MAIPITSDPVAATGVAALLDNPIVINAMSSELQSCTVSPACAILLSYFGTIPILKETIHTYSTTIHTRIVRVQLREDIHWIRFTNILKIKVLITHTQANLLGVCPPLNITDILI